jgi:hypothetical protein
MLFEEDSVKDYDLVKLYNEFNKKYFGGKLPTGVENVTGVDKKYDPNAGNLYVGTGRTEKYIGVAKFFLYNYENISRSYQVLLSNVFDYGIHGKDSTVAGILLHEMAHVSVGHNISAITYKKQRAIRTGHGPVFQAECKRINDILEKEDAPYRVPPDESPDSFMEKLDTGKLLKVIKFNTPHGPSIIFVNDKKFGEMAKSIIENYPEAEVYDISEKYSSGFSKTTKLSPSGRILKFFPLRDLKKADVDTIFNNAKPVKLNKAKIKESEGPARKPVYLITHKLPWGNLETFEMLSESTWKKWELFLKNKYKSDPLFKVYKTTDPLTEYYSKTMNPSAKSKNYPMSDRFQKIVTGPNSTKIV